MPGYEAPNVFGFCDAARRISDSVNQHIVDGHRGYWAAYRLQDGTSNERAYQKRSDAVYDMRPNERWYAYFKIPWDGCTPRAAEAFLKLSRQMADDVMVKEIGGQLVDPELANQEYMMDNRRETYPGDRRRLLTAHRLDRLPGERRTSGGLIIP